MKLAEALEAYKKACILYGYNVGIERGDGEEEQFTHWREQVLVTERHLVDSIVERVKGACEDVLERHTGVSPTNADRCDDGPMLKMFNN